MSREDRIELLFAEVIELPAEQRQAFVRERAADDAERDEILSLLAHHEQAESQDPFLSSPLARIDRDIIDDIRQQQPDSETILEIDGFEILEILGRGGMGVVYRARQHHPRRFVALKVVDPDQWNPDLLRRLQREAESLGRLEHPGIARLYQAGASDSVTGPRPWLAMELVDGLPLLDYVQRHRLGRRERLELLARVADAVHYAHTRDVIHRDLKPANVLVVDDPTTIEADSTDNLVRGARPKVLDFGVARIADAVDATRETEPGRIVGTLAWMSPEQCEAGGRIDARTDVYALGVMGFALLTGQRPYELAGLPLAVALRTIQETEPPLPSSFDGRLRGDLDTILAKALEKNPEQRYASAAELAAELRRHLRDEPILARPATLAERASKFVRRHRLLVASTTSILAILLVSLFLVGREAGRARGAETDMRFTLDLLEEILLTSDPYRQGRADATIREVLIDAAAQLDQRTDLRPRVRAHTCDTLGQAFHGQREHGRAIRWFQEARRLFAGLDGSDSPDCVHSAAWLALAYVDNRQFDAARSTLDEQVTPFLPPPEEDPLLHYRVGSVHVTLAYQTLDFPAALARARSILDEGTRLGQSADLLDKARSRLLRVMLSAGDNQAAFEIAEQLLHDREQRLGPEHAGTVVALRMVLEAADKTGRIEDSVAFARRLLQSLPALGAAHADRSAFLKQAAMTLRKAGQYEEAEQAIEQALAAAREQFGERHETTLGIRNSRSILWQDLGRPGLVAELEDLLLTCESNLGASPTTAAVTANLADALAERGESDRALALQRDAIDWFEKSVGPDHEMTIAARANLAAALLVADRSDEAIEILPEILKAHQRQFGEDHPKTLLVANNLAVTLKRLGRFDQAEPLFARLTESSDAAFPAGHPRRATARLTWALCLLEMERFASAEPLLKESLALLDTAVPKGHPYRVRTLQGLIELYQRTDRPADRDAYAERLADEN